MTITLRPLTPMQARFVEHYCAGKTQKESATLAGAIPKQASIVAHRMLQVPAVIDAIDKFNAKMAAVLNEKATYTAETATAELDQAIAFAMRTNNATAYARCIELKMKLRGLLEKDKGAEAAGFHISIVGLEAPGARTVTIEPSAADYRSLTMEDLL